jgi:phage-related protein
LRRTAMRKRIRIAKSAMMEAGVPLSVQPSQMTQTTVEGAPATAHQDVTDAPHTAHLMRLQRTYGNRQVQRLLATKRVQNSSRIAQRRLGEDTVDEMPSGQSSGDAYLQRMVRTKPGQVSRDAIQRGWFDDAVDWVSDTASDAGDWVADTAGDVADAAGSAWDTVSDGASDAWDAVSSGASSLWNTVTEGASAAWEGATSFAGEIWDSVAGGASAAWETLSDGAKAAWEGVVSAAQAVGGLASDAWEGLKSLGEEAWRQLSAAGRAVWEGIKWFGNEAWEFIRAVGVVVWEKLCFYGDTLWTFISNIPTRLWRLVVDAWEGITGLLSWLGEGAMGFLNWLGSGLVGAAQWAIDFLSDPSLDKLGEAVKQFVSWLGDGAIGALSWLWDGLTRGVLWALTVALHLLELLGLGEALSLLWGTIFHLRPLMQSEIDASGSIHGAGQIPYGMVWVDEGSVFTKVNGGRAVTTMHILHIEHPGAMSNSLAVHELTHVAQYEQTGAIYMAQALHAQLAGSNYDYGSLTGKHFPELDREAQAQLCQDYYRVGGDGAAPTDSWTSVGGTVNTAAQMRPLIAEMRAGRY